MSSLKKISGYPESAVSWALGKLSKEDQEKFNKTLGELESILGDKPEKSSGKNKKLPSALEVFEKHIIPIIKDGVRQMEMLDDGGKIQQLDVSCEGMRTDLENMSLDDLAGLHNRITSMEKRVQTLDNFFKYYKGLVYMAVQNMCETDGFTKWVQKRQVSKSTVYKYMAYTALIMRFPRLILCDLNFSQVVKHKERILSYMKKEENSKLSHQLSDSVEFQFGTSKVAIEYMESDVPHIKGVSLTVDGKILDQYEDVDMSQIQPVQTEGAMSIVSLEDELL